MTDDPRTWAPLRGPDSYTALGTSGAIETKVQASRFRAQVFRVADQEAARNALAAEKKRFHDAHHHCSAARIYGDPKPREWCDDDGEPSGTAGTPILQALQRSGAFDALVVVTRWFGGVKLGAGGLVRAYAEAAEAAIQHAPREVIARSVRFELEVAYEEIGAVEAVLARAGARVLRAERRFEALALFALTVPRSATLPLALELREATRAKARFGQPQDAGFES